MTYPPSSEEFESDSSKQPPEGKANPALIPDIQAQFCKINNLLESNIRVIEGLANSAHLDLRALNAILTDIETIKRENQTILELLKEK